MSDAPAANPLAATQARLNRSTRDHWSHFASHRERIEQLLLADGLTGSGRLCVLGAGNCNDLDLPRLLDQFDEVHLIDLDPAALGTAVRRQGVERSPGLRLHAPVDLTGVADVMAGWATRRPGAAAVDACVRRAATAPAPDLGGTFDTVLSPCLLSQLAGYASDTLGHDHPRGLALRRAIRDRHLRLLVELTAPGGAGVLVTDVASCTKVDGLAHMRENDLPDLLRRLVAGRRIFPALEPDALHAALRADPLSAATVEDVRMLRPWVWFLGPRRTFLVYALRFRKSRGAVLLDDRAVTTSRLVV